MTTPTGGAHSSRDFVQILVTGSTGLLGQALCRRLARGHRVVGVSRHPPAAGAAGTHVACDLSDAGQVEAVVGRLEPEVVIHAQALSDVDRCELEPATARTQNVETTANLLRALARRPACRLVYVSTDYVFDGEAGRPYDEAEAPCPLSVYGQTKREAEGLALQAPRAVVVRTSTLFGPGRMNFTDHVVARLAARQVVEAFIDQVTSPTYTRDAADGIAELVERLAPAWPAAATPRIYHVANTGGASRVAWARRIAALTGGDGSLIVPIPMAAQHHPARRPRQTVLASRYLKETIGRELRRWDEALRAYLLEHH